MIDAIEGGTSTCETTFGAGLAAEADDAGARVDGVETVGVAPVEAAAGGAGLVAAGAFREAGAPPHATAKIGTIRKKCLMTPLYSRGRGFEMTGRTRDGTSNAWAGSMAYSARPSNCAVAVDISRSF